jgi:hypothetical protein
MKFKFRLPRRKRTTRPPGSATITDPVAYTRAHTTSPAVLALLDEVERGRERRREQEGNHPAQ